MAVDVVLEEPAGKPVMRCIALPRFL